MFHFYFHSILIKKNYSNFRMHFDPILHKHLRCGMSSGDHFRAKHHVLVENVVLRKVKHVNR